MMSNCCADLFVCDGGITQLRAARAVFAELGVTDIPTVGLAERQIRESVLDEVPGIARAPIDEIAAVAGVNAETAEAVSRVAASAAGEK